MASESHDPPKCATCGRPTTKPHPDALPPFFCLAKFVNGRQEGCYVVWWARMAKEKLK